MRAAFWGCSAALLGVWLIGWLTLPDRVPLHFSGSGSPDRWGSRGEALLTVALVGGGLVLLFWLLARWVPRAPAELVNIAPADKRWWFSTDERSAELRRRIADDLYLIGAATLVLVVVIEAVTLAISHHEDPALPWWLLPIVGCYLAGLIAWSIWAVGRRYRTPRDV